MTRSTTSRRCLCIFAAAALISGLSALLLPAAFGQIVIHTACFIAPSGSPNRPADCNKPMATCDPIDYDCGWWWGTGKSRDTFVENPYRYCNESQMPDYTCKYTSDAACLEFRVYRTTTCTNFLCNGTVEFRNCYNSRW